MQRIGISIYLLDRPESQPNLNALLSQTSGPGEVQVIYGSLDKNSWLPATFEEVDLVVSESGMEDYHINQLFDWLAQNQINKPVWVITDQGDEHLAASMIRQGATEYFSKKLLTTDLLQEAFVRLQQGRLRYSTLWQEYLHIARLVLLVFDKEAGLQQEAGLSILTDQPYKRGLPPEALFEQYPAITEALTAARGGKEATILVSVGEQLFDVQTFPIRQDGKVTGMYLLGFNNTQRELVQRDLLKAKKEAERTAKIKEEFLANMSHEIRTPMNAIIGFTDILQSSKLDESQQHYVNSIKRASENLLVILNDILDFTKIESGKLNINKAAFVLSELTDSIKLMQEPKAEEKGIELAIQIDPYLPKDLYGDSVRIFQVLTNLVNNAIKFTERGKVLIDISQKINNAGRNLVFTVTDSGIGIPKDRLPQIFKSFTQVGSSTTRKYGGSGLGLTIVQRLATMLGGEIDVESTVGKGSTFTFCIALETPALTDLEHHEVRPVILHQALAGKRVLLVEDNKMNQAVAEKYLRDWGMEVEKAENGQEACLKVDAMEFDVVLMDIQMPIMNGFEATEYIRSLTDERANLPIIAMTANAFDSERQKCLDAGMTDYLSKPYKPNQLRDKLLENLVTAEEEEVVDPLVLEEQTEGSTQGKPCDLRLLANLSGGDKSFFYEMVQTYIESAPPVVDTLYGAAQEEDWGMLRKQAHKLKPSVSMMGMPKAQEILDAILSVEFTKEQYQQHANTIKEMVTESIDFLQRAKYPESAD